MQSEYSIASPLEDASHFHPPRPIEVTVKHQIEECEDEEDAEAFGDEADTQTSLHVSVTEHALVVPDERFVECLSKVLVRSSEATVEYGGQGRLGPSTVG